MKILLKIFVVFAFGVQLVNSATLIDNWDGAYDSFSECSLVQYYIDKKPKCIKLVYQEINERVERVYNNLIKTLPQNNKTKLIKEYSSWLKDKDKQCAKYSNNEIKLKSCHIDISIPKLNELWKLDEEINTNQFEGKWVGCFGFKDDDLKQRYGNFPICVAYFLIQQGNNICGTFQEWGSGRWYTARALFRTEDGRIANSVKVCNYGNFDFITCTEWKESNLIQTDFSNWTASDDLGTSTAQYMNLKSLSSHIKTPLLPSEREEVIKENKWLQDCLSYKGE